VSSGRRDAHAVAGIYRSAELRLIRAITRQLDSGFELPPDAWQRTKLAEMAEV
jgi:hypothetical protein